MARPDDLISVEEAARRVDRSKSTIRAWVRSGELTGYREDPARPENSRLLVSAQALMALVVVTAKAAHPGRPPREDEGLRQEVEALRANVLEALRANVAALEGRVGDLGRAVDAERRAVDAERSRAEEWRARALAAEAERDVLRKERGLPWWRRLLGGPLAIPEDGQA